MLRAAGPLDGPARERLADAVRRTLADARERGHAAGDAPAVAAAARAALDLRDRSTLRAVINATGVILHTNLGRAPLSARARAAMQEAAGAVSVEYDLDSGGRGDRHSHVPGLVAELSGAEDAAVTNNGAAALLLALAALAGGREVIVARGELVEVGGGFRIPDVLARSGAKLVEIGTTNRTYLRDYAAAVTERTAAVLRVHTSNFRIVGFTARASSAELAALARERGLAFVHDLGSGTLLDTQRFGLGAEETVPQAVAAGADVVTFSGDKLLGGPQAGLAVGRAALIARLRADPLMRAVRPDKVTLAGLLATLAAYRDGTAERELPVWRMIGAPAAEIERRCQALAARVGGTVVASRSTVGGGSLPEETQPSFALTVPGRPQQVAALLRAAEPPVIGRTVDDQYGLDLRSVLPEDDRRLGDVLAATLRDAGPHFREGDES